VARFAGLTTVCLPPTILCKSGLHPESAGGADEVSFVALDNDVRVCPPAVHLSPAEAVCAFAVPPELGVPKADNLSPHPIGLLHR